MGKNKPTIQELIQRDSISNDYAFEVFNKMTKGELQDWESDVTEQLISAGIPEKFPDWNGARLAKDIDYHILYTVIKKNKKQ